ncbi:flavin reductase family protein [Trinickia mobilis]|uniref:flavin reductase family protein n=1 Tax=Trinickia mobilis TaxID=2816356 RepID=UPI001A8D4CBE|nr:flavin reductase family protein [Trinickia mobilis]
MLDPEEFRKGLRAFTTGVTVISMPNDAGGMHAMTASSFAAVSIDPQLVAVSVAKTARSHAILSTDQLYAINILGENQAFHGHYFANRIPEKWNPPYEWHEGAPVLTGTMGWFVCRRWAAYEGGDHTILVGEALEIHRTDNRPLVCSRGHFYSLGAAVESVRPE